MSVNPYEGPKVDSRSERFANSSGQRKWTWSFVGALIPLVAGVSFILLRIALLPVLPPGEVHDATPGLLGIAIVFLGSPAGAVVGFLLGYGKEER